MTDLSKRTRAPKGVHDGGQLQPEHRDPVLSLPDEAPNSEYGHEEDESGQPIFVNGFTKRIADTWISNGFTMEEASEWNRAGFNYENAPLWRDAGYTDPYKAADWARLSLTPGYARFYTPDPNEKTEKKRIRFAQEWGALGVSLGEATDWSELNFTPAEAYLWRESRVPAVLAKRRRDAGQRPYQVSK
jgi:hypothetical protein